jgi:hypothetical protein
VDDPATVPSGETPGFNQYTRYKSFGSMLKKIRNRKTKCMKRLGYDPDTTEPPQDVRDECAYNALNAYDLARELNEEEVFLYAARWLIDQSEYAVIDTSENLVVWSRVQPGGTTPYQTKQLELACGYLHDDETVYFRTVVRKARLYCARLGLDRSLSPEEAKALWTPPTERDQSSIDTLPLPAPSEPKAR